MPEESSLQSEPIFEKSEEPENKHPRNIREKLFNAYYNAVPYFTLNLIWCALSLPMVTALPALGGLYYAILQMTQEGSADGRTVWEGFKKYWWLSLRWGLLVYGVGLLLLVNIWFYLSLDQAWAIVALGAAIGILIVWIAINQYSFPLLMLQEEKKIFLAIRNASVVAMRKPLAVLKVMALSLLISMVSFVLPPLWIFISMAWIINIRTRTVIRVVKAFHDPDIHLA